MSELTKIAAIFAKHLSHAFLSIHCELEKGSESPLSQAQKSVSLEQKSSRPKPLKLESYHSQEKVIVQLEGVNFPLKMRVLKRLSDTEYLVYNQGQPKRLAVKATYNQILGIDPDP